MNQKRRTNDIIASEILKLCMNGASKTRIIHKANLNFLSAKSHIESLMNNGLMEAVPLAQKSSTAPPLKERSYLGYSVSSIARWTSYFHMLEPSASLICND